MEQRMVPGPEQLAVLMNQLHETTGRVVGTLYGGSEERGIDYGPTCLQAIACKPKHKR